MSDASPVLRHPLKYEKLRRGEGLCQSLHYSYKRSEQRAQHLIAPRNAPLPLLPPANTRRLIIRAGIVDHLKGLP